MKTIILIDVIIAVMGVITFSLGFYAGKNSERLKREKKKEELKK